EQDEWYRSRVHDAVFHRRERAAEAAERYALEIRGCKPGFLHHQHAHQFAERFRIADAEFLVLEVLHRLDRRIRHDDQHEVGERCRGVIDDLEILALVDGGDHARGRDLAIAEAA